jgi:adenylylsulfate kinase
MNLPSVSQYLRHALAFYFCSIFASIMVWVLWFTGLPGCGKTTIAELVKAMLKEKKIDVKILQLDEIRRIITPQPKYSEEERDLVYASLAYMAKLLYEAGVNVIVDATANRASYRKLARSLVANFGEVYFKAPLEVCIARESLRKAEFAPKDIYMKAIKEKALVPGVGISYEPPETPEIEVDTYALSATESARFVVGELLDLFYGNANHSYNSD